MVATFILRNLPGVLRKSFGTREPTSKESLAQWAVNTYCNTIFWILYSFRPQFTKDLVWTFINHVAWPKLVWPFFNRAKRGIRDQIYRLIIHPFEQARSFAYLGVSTIFNLWYASLRYSVSLWIQTTFITFFWWVPVVKHLFGFRGALQEQEDATSIRTDEDRPTGPIPRRRGSEGRSEGNRVDSEQNSVDSDRGSQRNRRVGADKEGREQGGIDRSDRQRRKSRREFAQLGADIRNRGLEQGNSTVEAYQTENQTVLN